MNLIQLARWLEGSSDENSEYKRWVMAKLIDQSALSAKMLSKMSSSPQQLSCR